MTDSTIAPDCFTNVIIYVSDVAIGTFFFIYF